MLEKYSKTWHTYIHWHLWKSYFSGKNRITKIQIMTRIQSKVFRSKNFLGFDPFKNLTLLRIGIRDFVPFENWNSKILDRIWTGCGRIWTKFGFRTGTNFKIWTLFGCWNRISKRNSIWVRIEFPKSKFAQAYPQAQNGVMR